MLFVVLLAAIAVSFSFAEPPANFSGWEKVFEDNFDGTSLDKTKWNPTYNWGPTHNHRAYCAEENVIVSDGTLKLKGEKKTHPDANGRKAKFNNKEIPVDYTSGAIDTRGHFEVKYGYIEGRFKAPSQKGTWPAFWTLQDGWPPEIDILEIPASRKQHHYYLHYTDPSWYSGHGSAWDHEASFGGHKDDDVDRSADFHNYGVEWDESTLSFYFDDKRFASYNRPTEISQLTAQYIIVNLAIGGWAGDDIEITKPAKPDTVKIFSMNFGTCMVRTSENKLALGDCDSDSALVVVTPLSSTTFRFGFGDLSIDVPDESKDAGITMGLYQWNGGAHQKVIMEKQAGYEGTVVRMKMQNSNMYLRATTDGERVVQSWADDWEWNQMWRILPNEPQEPDSPDGPEALASDPNAYSYGSSIRYTNGNLSVELGSAFSRDAEIRVLDLRGREVMRQRVAHSATMDVQALAPGIYHVMFSDGKNRTDIKRFKK